MSEDTQNIEKTIRSFEKEASRIRKAAGGASVGLRPKGKILRIVGIVFISLQMLAVILPPFTYPVSGRVTSGYILRQKPDRAFPSVEVHKGIDIAAPKGTRVKAAAPGRIHETGWNETAGNYVLVRHLFGFSTYYAHMHSVTATEGGYRIAKSLPIGTVGSSGRSTGFHLHFEIRLLGWRLPPGIFLIYHAARRLIIGI